jgi:hypothetical protein
VLLLKMPHGPKKYTKRPTEAKNGNLNRGWVLPTEISDPRSL